VFEHWVSEVGEHPPAALSVKELNAESSLKVGKSLR
jgi:hypothetical protein